MDILIKTYQVDSTGSVETVHKLACAVIDDVLGGNINQHLDI